MDHASFFSEATLIEIGVIFVKYDCPGECSLINQTIIPRARMDSESIAHEVEGRMGY